MWYTQIVASLQKVTTRGYTYWRIVESRRVQGKPRPVPVLYLGTADQLLRRLQQAEGGRLRLRSSAHGAVAALVALAHQLDVVRIIDRHVPRRRHRLSVGTTLLLVALNRAIRPRSKRAWAEWAQQTSLAQLWRVPLPSLTSQFFWDQMDCVPVTALPAIEADLTRQVVRTLGLSLDTLFYDTTNFFTFIDSTTTRAQLPQRGHSKQHRFDLRQIGLALLVSREAHIPLLSRVYAGHQPDVRTFPESLTAMRERLEQLVGQVEALTLVYDKGNTSKVTQAQVDQAPFHYVASLVPAQHPDLLGIPTRAYRPLGGEGPLKDVPVYRLRHRLWGQERTVVLFLSEQLRAGQRRGLEQHLGQRLRRLRAWAEQLQKPRSGPRSAQAAHRQITELLRGQHLARVLQIEYHPERSGRDRLHWWVDHAARQHLEQEVFGKRILITNRHEWPTEEILLAYRGQSRVEAVFRQLKDPEHLAVRPQYHWTDQKIRVHLFCCLLAYLLGSVLEYRARRAGFPAELATLIEQLDRVRLAMVLHSEPGRRGRPRVTWQLEEADPTAMALYRAIVPDERVLGYTGAPA